MVAALGGLATAAAGQTLVGTGSGFLVNESGWVLTNAHVVEGCDVVREANLGNAVSVISDTGADLALVLFRGEQDSEPLPLRDRPVRLPRQLLHWDSYCPISWVARSGRRRAQ